MSFDIRARFAQKANKRGRYSQRAARNPSEAKGILVRPRIESFSEPIMPAYEICYLDQDGSLTYKFSATCDDDQRAKILAHAMKLPSAKRLEVWSGDELIYTRPSMTLERRLMDHQQQLSA
jgi:hypothetical protein